MMSQEWVDSHRSPRSISSKVWIEGLPKAKKEEVIDALCWTYPTWYFEILAEFENGPLILEPFQVDFLLDPSPYRIELKTRQAGGSVSLALAKLFKAQTNYNYRCDIVSINLKEASSKISMIRAFWETIPRKYRVPLEVDNALSIGFHKGKSKLSVVNSMAASGAIRGARKDIVFDEFAHIPMAEEMFEAALPAIINGDLGMDIVSTPRGSNNLFAEIWKNPFDVHKQRFKYNMFSRHKFIWLDVRRFVTDFEAVQREWKECGEDVAQLERLMRDYGSEKLKDFWAMRPWDYMLQEFCGVFLDDNYAFFTYDLLDKTFKPSIGQLEDQREKEWLEPWNDKSGRPFVHGQQNDNVLLMGVDFGQSGSSQDKTSIQIVEKLPNGDLRHRFSKNLTRREFHDFPAQAAEIARIADAFEVNKLIGDETGLGAAVLPMIKRMVHRTNVSGVVFNTDNKHKMMLDLKSMMEKNQIWLMQDETDLYHELHGIQAETLPSGKIRYHGEPHDDMVWALALAISKGTKTPFAMYTIESLLRGEV